MKTIKLLETLRHSPLFTNNDLSKILGYKPDYIKTLINRLKKNMLIKKIERGKYTVYDDPLVFASLIYTPSYISLWTALRYYNLTEQLPKTIFVFTTKYKKSIIFNNTEILFIKTKHFFGFEKTKYCDFDIFMVDKEKLLLDCLISKKVPFDDVISIINSIDCKKLIKYVLKTKNKSLAKRVGFILEELKIKSKSLLSIIDNNYIRLDYDMDINGKKNKKWKIIDNRNDN